MGSEDYLHALETMGKILLLTPIFLQFLLYFIGFRDKGPGIGPDAVFSTGLMMAAGLFTLVYAAVLRFLEGKREAEKRTSEREN